MLPGLLQAFRALPAFSAFTSRLPAQGQHLEVTGLPGSSRALLVAAIAEHDTRRVLLVVTGTPADAERWEADLHVLLGETARLYPQREAFGQHEPHYEIAGERVETIDALARGATRVVITTLRATVERTPDVAGLTRHRLDLGVGFAGRPAHVVEQLEAMGYERTPSVTDVAQYAVRGGIIDVYGFGMAAPARLEWWGDEVISIRSFDLDTQRSLEETGQVTVLPIRSDVSETEARDGHEPEGEGDETTTLLDVMPADTLIVVDDAVDQSDAVRIWDDAEHHVQLALRRGEDLPGRETVFVSPEEWDATWRRFARLRLRDGVVQDGTGHDFRLIPPEPVDRDMRRLQRLVRLQPTLILCDNDGQLERLEELLSVGDVPGDLLPAGVTLALGALHGGFVLPDLIVLTDHEIFRRARRIRRPRRFRQAMATAASPLTPGDYVVHLEHGIGIYQGIEQIDLGESDARLEVAVVEYEGGDRLNVPLYRIDQLERYRAPGDDQAPPRLDRLGGTRWRRRRDKTQRAIRHMAAELVELYARRAVTTGFAYPPDTRWQRELESAFLYEDTEDQRTATEDVKRDMELPAPMDRLIVGDVGYGKTEVAVRAAFKAVQSGKQTAVLAPTTILAEQHGRTFAERLADFPVRVEVLSRFRTPAEQKAVIAGLAEGTVDIVIGTHRLLSPDVTFKDLGFLVIDEEHRFGVKHKERLKALRLEIDVLTLTATPIPRTLHLALAGLRPLSLIETPPRDRSPVLTFVEPWDDELLEEVMARELDRGGQVYFVHNRIETIGTIAQRVERLAPRARLAVAHGQMRERELDDVMRRFVAGEVDVLVSTMIVESGLDVANANTMIVHDAWQFGLAQLYQLRGRVGRAHRRAYCYLLTPERVDRDAEQRLQILEHHTALGSGYRIALRDLELRGAGNLLGAEQSGYAHAVGIDTYMRWLQDAVRALQNEGAGITYPPSDVTVDGGAHLPDEYVPDEDAKLDLYRRLASATEPGDIQRLREELRDRFGRVPEEADRLLVIGELRVLGARLGLETVLIRGDEARLSFRAGAAPRLAGLTAALDEVQFAADVRRAMPLSLRLTRLGGMEIGAGLVRALRQALGDTTDAVGQAASATVQES